MTLFSTIFPERIDSHPTKRFHGSSYTLPSETGEEQHPSPRYTQEVFIADACADS